MTSRRNAPVNPGLARPARVRYGPPATRPAAAAAVAPLGHRQPAPRHAPPSPAGGAAGAVVRAPGHRRGHDQGGALPHGRRRRADDGGRPLRAGRAVAGPPGRPGLVAGARAAAVDGRVGPVARATRRARRGQPGRAPHGPRPRRRLVERRDGVWARPDNLPPEATPAEARAVLAAQAERWSGPPGPDRDASTSPPRSRSPPRPSALDTCWTTWRPSPRRSARATWTSWRRPSSSARPSSSRSAVTRCCRRSWPGPTGRGPPSAPRTPSTRTRSRPRRRSWFAAIRSDAAGGR